MNPLVEEWAQLGEHRELAGHRIFTVDVPARGDEQDEPLLVLHGFPSSSFDFRAVLDGLRRSRRVLLLDMLGYGLSDKPDLRYAIAVQADIVMAFVRAVGVDRLALLTHDMGDTVGGELLARNQEGAWPVEITRRVLTNGSIYIEMAQLSAGQQMLLAMPDVRMPADGAIDPSMVEAGIAATFSPSSVVDAGELAAQGELVGAEDGHRMLARLIRYIEERRAHERRYTGAIETHPSPLDVVWGVDDPIAVVAMADRLVAARRDAGLTRLAGVGHYPMIEAPRRFADAVGRYLTTTS